MHRNKAAQRTEGKTRPEAGATPPCRAHAAPVPTGVGGHSRLWLLEGSGRVLPEREMVSGDL
jgi:hypothetical protein